MTTGDQLAFVQYGWICAKCGASYAPTTRVCFYCRPLAQTGTEIVPGTGVDILPPFPKITNEAKE